jgi:transcriptional regulator with XRE-family HTH domain
MRLNLILWEKKNNFKAKDVAKKLGISETTYSLIRNGKTMPSLEFAYKFKEVFGVENVLELLKKEEK